MKVVCSVVEAGCGSTVAEEEFGGGGAAECSWGAGIPATPSSPVSGGAGAGKSGVATGLAVVCNREAGLTGGALLSRLAGFWEVVGAKEVVGDDGLTFCGWLIWIPSSSGISPVCSKAEKRSVGCGGVIVCKEV